MKVRHWRRLLATVAVCCVFFAGCVSPRSELQGIAELPPVDAAVLVTGGAFLRASPGAGTFAPAEGGGGDEALAIGEVYELLQRARVFQRVALDDDPARRERLREMLTSRQAGDELATTLARAREQGFDLLLVVEELQDGPIDRFGTNARWPVTLVTWVLLGVGAFIPDRTFESRATLRVTVRDLQTGFVLHDPLLTAGPIDLALTERTDLLGLLSSIVVPPFLVGDDPAAVTTAVRSTTERRLLLSLARDLKSESVRQRLRVLAPAGIQLERRSEGAFVVVDSPEGLSLARLRCAGLADDAAERFARELLASRRGNGGRFRYEASLPAVADGELVQVAVATVVGGVASATFAAGSGP